MDKSNTESDKVTKIDKLITDLSSKNIKTRENARSELVLIGEPAVVPLLNLLRSPDEWLHWEAAKALAEMREPHAAPILVGLLTNRDPNIRWLSAEGLIALGSISLEPLLEGLTHYSGSSELAAGAHHVLHDLYEGKVHEGEYEYQPFNPISEDIKSLIKPVIISLETPGSLTLIPEYSKAALHDLKQMENRSI